MAEVCRQRIRKVLGEATCITLAWDASKYRKVVRFRADRPTVEREGSLWREYAGGFSQSGVLGILDCSNGLSL